MPGLDIRKYKIKYGNIAYVYCPYAVAIWYGQSARSRVFLVPP
jgi:hypothetical protein